MTLSTMEPILNMIWHPENEQSSARYSNYGQVRKDILQKLHQVCLEKSNVYNKYKLKDFSYYKTGKFFEGKDIKSNSNEFLTDKDISYVSFRSSSDYKAINDCNDFSQEMAYIMLVLDAFIDANGKIFYDNFYINPEEIVKDVLGCYDYEFNGSNEDTIFVRKIISLITGFELAFSRKSGPLIHEVHTLFFDIIKCFEGVVTEYNLRQNFFPFFSLFVGNMDDFDVSVDAIGSKKICAYKKKQALIPDDEPLKKQIEKALAIFYKPINNKDVMTYIYDNDSMCSVVFILIDDSYDNICISRDMMHPFYFDILMALHNDIDYLFTKYHII